MLTGPWSLFPFAFRGFALGLAIAAPVGPIGVLCIRRTLANGRLVGFVSGLGAAMADAFYGAIAAFGVSFIPLLLEGARLWVHLIGAILIAVLGVHIILAKPPSPAPIANGGESDHAPRGHSPARLATAWITTLGLTLTNPATILSFAALFAGIGLASAHAPVAVAGITVAGVFMGSACWWLLLSWAVGLARTQVTPGAMRWVNRISGLSLLGFAVYALLTL